jgi:hypothetical protein
MPPRGRDRRAVVIEPDTAKHGSIGGGSGISALPGFGALCIII